MVSDRKIIAGASGDRGRTAADNRVFINGVLWVLRSGAHWHDLSERYAEYKSVHKRFSRWSASGVREKVYHDLVADRKNAYLMIARPSCVLTRMLTQIERILSIN